MRKQFLVFAMAAGLVGVAPRLAAQGGGLWMGLGVGTGMNQLACEICVGENNGGWSARIGVGGTLNPKIRLGGEVHGWTDRTDDIRFMFYSITPAVYWYPSRNVPYFFMGGVGYAHYRAADDNEVVSSTGVGVTAGLGMDLPLFGRFRLTPFAMYTGSFLAGLKLDRTDIANARLMLIQAGMGITRR